MKSRLRDFIPAIVSTARVILRPINRLKFPPESHRGHDCHNTSFFGLPMFIRCDVMFIILYFVLHRSTFFFFLFPQVQKRSWEMFASRTWWLKTATTEVAKRISVSSTACGPCGTVCSPPCSTSIPFCWPLGDYRVRLCAYHTYGWFRYSDVSSMSEILAMSIYIGNISGAMSQ